MENTWNIIQNEKDSVDFLKTFLSFHDSVITDIKYIPNPEPYHRKDGSSCWNTSLIISFNVYSFKQGRVNHSEKDVPSRCSIEVEFKRVHKFNFIPFDEGGTNILGSADIRFINGNPVCGESPGICDQINEYGFTDKKSWLICEEIRWKYSNCKGLW